jgi:hypothetical protein
MSRQETPRALPSIVALTAVERRRALPWLPRDADLGAQLDRLLQNRITIVSLARARALARGLDDGDEARELLLCIDAERQERDRMAAELAARVLPSIWFADAGESIPAGAGHWTALRALAAMGVTIELRGRADWETGKAPAEHIFAAMIRARGELERRLGRSVTLYRLATPRPAAEFFDLLERVGYEFSAGHNGSGASLRLESWRECLARIERHGARAKA